MSLSASRHCGTREGEDAALTHTRPRFPPLPSLPSLETRCADSDSFGRKNAFNGTLFVTAIFGCASSFATSFPMLCLLCFLLGTGVGGSMPTDGTLFLENLPRSKQYLLTALSVFFALGSVITSLLALLIIPANSCPPPPPDGTGGMHACNVQEQNQGWRWLLNGLGFVVSAPRS